MNAAALVVLLSLLVQLALNLVKGSAHFQRAMARRMLKDGLDGIMPVATPLAMVGVVAKVVMLVGAFAFVVCAFLTIP